MTELEATAFDAVTFDCYGTLIDWEAGILEAVRPLLERRGIRADDETVLAAYARAESGAEAGEHVPYREVLERTLVGLAGELGFEPDEDERGVLVEALPGWVPFPDAIGAIRRLARRFPLGVISNVDEDLFEATRERLPVEFTWVITAESVGAYKPSPEVFRDAVERIGHPPGRILHVAQSLHHDVGPAREAGLRTVHVARRGGGPGATPPSEADPHHVVPDLSALTLALLPNDPAAACPADPGEGE